MLIEFGVEAEWTTSGNEAILRAKQASLRGRSYGLYIIDWRLPDISGIDVAKQLVKEFSADIPMLLMTAYDKSVVWEEALNAGIKGFCSKPLFISELYGALVRIMDSSPEPNEEKASVPGESLVSFAGKCVLLADDVMINRQLAKKILTMYGFEVDEAEDGDIAVKKVQEAPAGYYDVILMDVQMPKMNGYEALKAIRALDDPEKAGVPIFAMTANAFDEDKQNAESAGMNGHIAKPIDREMLIKTLKELFD